jgi:hypothetical protein
MPTADTEGKSSRDSLLRPLFNKSPPTETTPSSEITVVTSSPTATSTAIPGDATRKNKPTGYNGVKHPSMFCIPVHLWASPILHDELGLVKDWLTRVEKFCDTRIETLPDDEVAIQEHLVILGDMLEDLLMEQDDLSPKETFKDYEAYLKAAVTKEIKNLK